MRTRESSKADCASNSDQDNFILGDGKVGKGPTEYSLGFPGRTPEETSNTQRNWSCEPKEKLPLYSQNIYKAFSKGSLLYLHPSRRQKKDQFYKKI